MSAHVSRLYGHAAGSPLWSCECCFECALLVAGSSYTRSADRALRLHPHCSDRPLFFCARAANLSTATRDTLPGLHPLGAAIRRRTHARAPASARTRLHARSNACACAWVRTGPTRARVRT
eukprot:6179998-Pleurochrysis_carterae.AAC.1